MSARSCAHVTVRAGSGKWPTPGFFRITGKKYFVLYRSQAQNISYSIDHRQKIRILPKRYFCLYLLVGGRKRLVFSGSQVKNISYSTDYRQKIFRTLPKMVGGRKPYRLSLRGKPGAS